MDCGVRVCVCVCYALSHIDYFKEHTCGHNSIHAPSPTLCSLHPPFKSDNHTVLGDRARDRL